MKIYSVLLCLLFLGSFLITGNANANTVFLDDLHPDNDASLICGTPSASNEACRGFTGTTGAVGSGAAQFSFSLADEQPGQSGDAAELALLNSLILSLSPAGAAVTGVFKDDTAQITATITREYFAIKKKDDIFYFQNLSGGALEISLVRPGGEIPDDWSHMTEFGDVATVPLPAAVWLFGSAVLGLVTIAKRKKLKA